MYALTGTLFTTGLWFSPGTPVGSGVKHHNPNPGMILSYCLPQTIQHKVITIISTSRTVCYLCTVKPV
jgi:hypothetical protein